MAILVQQLWCDINGFTIHLLPIDAIALSGKKPTHCDKRPIELGRPKITGGSISSMNSINSISNFAPGLTAAAPSGAPAYAHPACGTQALDTGSSNQKLGNLHFFWGKRMASQWCLMHQFSGNLSYLRTGKSCVDSLGHLECHYSYWRKPRWDMHFWFTLSAISGQIQAAPNCFVLFRWLVLRRCKEWSLGFSWSCFSREIVFIFVMFFHGVIAPPFPSFQIPTKSHVSFDLMFVLAIVCLNITILPSSL